MDSSRVYLYKGLKMIRFLVAGVMAFALYLILTMGTGPVGEWSLAELIVGAILSLVVGIMARNVLVKKGADYRILNPLRWLALLVYLLGPFLFAMARANIDVAYRVITGKINPGIVKISPGLKTDLGVTMLANSITLTPGTLSVDVNDENDLYVHWINVRNPEPSPQEVCGGFPNWVRRIAE